MNLKWRHYVSKEKLREMIAPDSAVVRHVVDTLQGLGMKEYELYETGDFLMTYWPVHALEAAFGVQMERFVHVTSRQTIHRSLEPATLPENLLRFVDILGMVSEFPEGHFKTRKIGRAHV